LIRLAWKRILGLVLALGMVEAVMAPSLAQRSPAVPRSDCSFDPPTLETWPREQDLSDFNQWMACLGSRFTGDRGHLKLLAEIDASLGRIPGLQRKTYPVSFTSWTASRTSLTLVGSDPSVPVAGYMPYSGLTSDEPNGTIEAELVFQRPGFWKRLFPLANLGGPLKIRKRHAGKIVAFWVPTVRVPKFLLKYVAQNRDSDFGNWAPYRRPITLEKQAPCLNEARRMGVRGVILILDMSPPHAEGQYLPFTRDAEPLRTGVPGIHVDRDQRRRLEDHAEKRGRAVLELDGAFDCLARSEHQVYTLPGARFGQDEDEIVLLQTHTDGPGAVEENGVMALIALAHHFASVPEEQRRRTLVFLFATGHFVAEIEGAKNLLWKDPPDWFKRTKAAIAIEHLGAKEWADGPKGYASRCEDCIALAEPVLLFVPGDKHPLAELAVRHLPSERTIVIPMRPRTEKVFGRKFFGEGQYVACTGVPTVGYVPNPDYMFSWADPGGPTQRGHFEKLDPARMRVELDAFRDLVTTLVTDDLTGWPEVTPDLSLCEEAEPVCR
jgi:hypothetical protein